MLGMASIDSTNPILASNALASSFNIVYPELNTSGSSWTNPSDYATYLPSREATGEASATSTQFPDWTFSGLQWITGVGSLLLNVIGAPYTLSMMIAPNSAGAIVGTGLALLNLFIIIGWILGKID